jgi:hypothetical protein
MEIGDALQKDRACEHAAEENQHMSGPPPFCMIVISCRSVIYMARRPLVASSGKASK